MSICYINVQGTGKAIWVELFYENWRKYVWKLRFIHCVEPKYTKNYDFLFDFILSYKILYYFWWNNFKWKKNQEWNCIGDDGVNVHK